MSDVVNEQGVSSEDWAAAMNEQGEASALEGGFASASEPRAANPAVFEQFNNGPGGRAATHNDIDLVLDIPVQLTVELGRTKLPIRNLLQLAQGSVVELDGLAGEPMDVLVNGCLIAQGEVVVVNEKFGIRLTDVITAAERMKRLSK
jgi:flagellar motor switch protein FliN/FliY